MAGCDFLALWEAGEADHPLDRALGLIETLEGTPRAEAARLPLDRRDRALYRIAARLFGSRIRLVGTCADCGAETALSFSTEEALEVPEPAERLALGDGTAVCRVPDSRDLAQALAAPDPRGALISALLDDPALTLAHRCTACGSEGATPFDILDYLWRRITVEAQHLLRDIHVIAGAYGWTGEAIAALSPRRRAAHVALIGG